MRLVAGTVASVDRSLKTSEACVFGQARWPEGLETPEAVLSTLY